MGRQLELFVRPKGRGPVGPAAQAAEIVELGARLPDGVRLGTSSWSFPGWGGLVWDRDVAAATLARAGLGAYAAHPLIGP